jgi:hypothetical protein
MVYTESANLLDTEGEFRGRVTARVEGRRVGNEVN